MTDSFTSDGLSPDQILDRLGPYAWCGNVGVYYYVRVSFAARAMFLGDVETLRGVAKKKMSASFSFTTSAFRF